MKEQNVKILDPFLKTFVKSNFAEMMSDDYDVDTMVYDLGITDDDNITDDEKEMLDDIVKSLRKEFIAKLQKKLFMSIKRYDMLTEVICKDKRKETPKKNERDMRIQREMKLKKTIEKSPLASKLEKNIVPDESSNICLDFLIPHLMGEDWKIDKMRQYQAPHLGGHTRKDEFDETNTHQWFIQYNKVQTSVTQLLRLMGLKSEYCETPGSYWSYEENKHKKYTTSIIRGYRYNADIDLSWDTTIC